MNIDFSEIDIHILSSITLYFTVWLAYNGKLVIASIADLARKEDTFFRATCGTAPTSSAGTVLWVTTIPLLLQQPVVSTTRISLNMLVFFLAVLLAILVALTSGQHRLPSKTECRRLAAADPSNCLSSEMQSYCEDACNRQHRLSLLEKFGYSRVKSFYDLKAQDLQGRQLDFYRFRGKVVLITNVASYCGKCLLLCESFRDPCHETCSNILDRSSRPHKATLRTT
jgi:hypothetical protein